MSSLGPGMITHGFLRSFTGEGEGGRACGRTTPAGSIAPVRAGPQAAYVIPLVGFALAVVGGGVRRGRIGAWIKPKASFPRIRCRCARCAVPAPREMGEFRLRAPRSMDGPSVLPIAPANRCHSVQMFGCG